MRKFYDNNLDNNLAKMFNSQRDYLLQEINRLAMASQRDQRVIKNGYLNSGAMQMTSFIDDEIYATIGTTLTSTVVQ